MLRPVFAIAWVGALLLTVNASSATLETVHPTVPEVAPMPPAPEDAAAATEDNTPATPTPANGAASDSVPSVQDLENKEPDTGDADTPAMETPDQQAPAGHSTAPAAAKAPAGAPGAMPGANAAQAAQPPAPQAAALSGDLWERIRKGFQIPDLATKKATLSTRWYASQPDYIDRMTTRASLYLYYIVQEIEKRGMPTELALLPFVESAMQPQAVSPAQAAGLWQFIPSTGRVYSLEQNLWKDERLGVVESTRAALDYLQKLHDEFGSWQLALAAYNYGENGVEKALDYNRKHHKPLTYEALIKLPRETQYYVPKLQAIKNIVSDPQRYGIDLPAIRDQPYFVTVSGSRDIDVATAAHLADMPLEDFEALNPAFNRPLIVGAMAPTILLPADRGDKFGANLAAWEATGQPLASWTAYRLKGGETLSAVAERVGVTEASLRVANHVPPRYVVGAGSTILVPRDEAAGEDVSGDMLDGSVALVPERPGLRKISIKVRRGESIGMIARRWHVDEDEIVAWNGLRSPVLLAGQRLNLTVASTAVPRKKPSHPKKTITQSAASEQSTTVARDSGTH
jgi:membrane-bound lytic murein transglycosylase D